MSKNSLATFHLHLLQTKKKSLISISSPLFSPVSIFVMTESKDDRFCKLALFLFFKEILAIRFFSFFFP